MRFAFNRRVFISENVPVASSGRGHRPSQASRKSSRALQIHKIVGYKSVRDWFFGNLKNYCNSTSLHGFNYVTLKGLSRWERIFWISIVIVSIIVSIVLVTLAWFWNRETPTVTVIESSHFPTWNVPFPAVTICNFNKISRRKAIHLVKTMKRPANVTEEDLLQLFYLTMYFSFALSHSEVNFNNLRAILQLNNFTFHNLSELLAPNCMDMVSRCVWKGTRTRCASLFQPTITTEGFCCTFNYFGMATNNFPKKIAYQVPKRPYRVTGCGYATGLSVVLNPISDDYFGTYFSSYGFRLLIHDAYNFPDENAETKVVTSTRESFVRINPESTYATEDVKGMDIGMRNCLFANERRLFAMQRYSFVNCMSECRIQMLYNRCNCIPPNLPNNGSYPVCDIDQIFCVVENRDIFTRAMPNFLETLSIVKDTNSFPCDCMPDCESNHYPSEITIGLLNINVTTRQANKSSRVGNINDQILLHVFFSDLMSTRYRKEIFANWLSSLASFGGLLGLIMGFSIVTLFEFFYFLTFRPIFNYFNDM